MGTVNAYLVQGEYNTLIDCGEKSDAVWEALQVGLKDNGLRIEDIDRLVITHAHVDHMGMARKVAEESGAEVLVSDLVYDWAVNLDANWERRNEVIRTTFESELSNDQVAFLKKNLLGFFGIVTEHWDAIPAELVSTFSHTGRLDISGSEYSVLHCPGHTYTQTCFYNTDHKSFFSADMLLRITPTPVIDFDPDNPSQRIIAMPQMIDSYHLLRTMDLATIYPGHYDINEDHVELINRQLDRINMRLDQCCDLIKDGTDRFINIFLALYNNKLNFPGLTMALGYLDLLLVHGRIRRVQQEDGAVYELA